MRHVYLGPEYTNQECISACEQYPGKPTFERLDDAPAYAAGLLAACGAGEEDAAMEEMTPAEHAQM